MNLVGGLLIFIQVEYLKVLLWSGLIYILAFSEILGMSFIYRFTWVIFPRTEYRPKDLKEDIVIGKKTY